jgi:hypothetical protein
LRWYFSCRKRESSGSANENHRTGNPENNTEEGKGCLTFMNSLIFAMADSGGFGKSSAFHPASHTLAAARLPIIFATSTSEKLETLTPLVRALNSRLGGGHRKIPRDRGQKKTAPQEGSHRTTAQIALKCEKKSGKGRGRTQERVLESKRPTSKVGEGGMLGGRHAATSHTNTMVHKKPASS